MISIGRYVDDELNLLSRYKIKIDLRKRLGYSDNQTFMSLENIDKIMMS